MPIQDASKPSRRQILAEQRRKYGAYEEVRLAKLPPPKLRLQKRSIKHDTTSKSFLRSLVKRDDASGDSVAPNPDGRPAPLPAAPPTSGAIPAHDHSVALPPAPDTSGAISAAPPANPLQPDTSQPDAPAAASDRTTNNDTSPASPPPSLPVVPFAPASNRSTDQRNHISHRTVATIAAVTVFFVVFVGSLWFFKRYRQKLSVHCRKESPKKRRQRSRSQRLGSCDGLRHFANRKEENMGGGVRGESKEVLLMHPSSNCNSGPFDRAMENMLPFNQDRKHEAVREEGSRGKKVLGVRESEGPYDRAVSNLFNPSQPKTQLPQADAAHYLSVTIPTRALHHQRSLDSIAEVQEPPSTVSTQFRNSIVRVPDEMGHLVDSTPPPPRPRTSPSTSRNSILSTVSPESTRSSKTAPKRPATARERDIEMTRSGTHLLIRDRASTGTLRRPLSSAGNSFRSALRKTRNSDGGICIETEGISDNHKRVSWATPEGEKGVFELAVPPRVRELRYHFSSSTLRTDADAQRESCVSEVSPSGSYSFEIREGVRKGAPVALSRGPSRLEIVQREEGEKKESVDGFVADLDWDLNDYTASVGEVWSTSAEKEVS
ncbi:uncharacterized protein UHOD_02552 [Ustilago sp. UG-2017b]|nr:uncharacterized protein UHOD_02552 [Ustilago sp. UG-2017b]